MFMQTYTPNIILPEIAFMYSWEFLFLKTLLSTFVSQPMGDIHVSFFLSNVFLYQIRVDVVYDLPLSLFCISSMFLLNILVSSSSLNICNTVIVTVLNISHRY